MSFSAVMDDIVKKLKSNPLYWASLGSRELFHSNFLGWLFEQYPSSAKAILNVDIEKFEVLREEHNIDLLLKSSNCLIAIENKFKDVPSAEQLDRYTALLNKHYDPQTTKMILLTLMPPSDIIEDWKTILYISLIGSLEKWIENPGEKLSHKHKIYILDYIQLISGIVGIINAFEDHPSYWFELHDNKSFEALKNIRFQDTVIKHCASRFHQDVKILLSKDCILSEDIVSNFSMHNKQAAAHFSISTANDKNRLGDNDISLGVSIQGRTYRRVIGMNAFNLKDNRVDEDITCILGELEKSRNFKTSDWLPKWDGKKGEPIIYNVKSYSTKMTKLYGSYKPAYIYRYIDIGGDTGLKIGELKNHIESDMQLAKKLIEKIKA